MKNYLMKQGIMNMMKNSKVAISHLLSSENDEQETYSNSNYPFRLLGEKKNIHGIKNFKDEIEYPLPVKENSSDEEAEDPDCSNSLTSSSLRCQTCFRSFHTIHEFRNHMKIHYTDRPYECEECSQRFSRLHDLKRHERLHTGLKPFVCPSCSRPFSRRDALNRHIRSSKGRSCERHRNRFQIYSPPNPMKVSELLHHKDSEEPLGELPLLRKRGRPRLFRNASSTYPSSSEGSSPRSGSSEGRFLANVNSSTTSHSPSASAREKLRLFLETSSKNKQLHTNKVPDELCSLLLSLKQAKPQPINESETISTLVQRNRDLESKLQQLQNDMNSLIEMKENSEQLEIKVKELELQKTSLRKSLPNLGGCRSG